jgi:SSS family solute:Na+ symporter
LRYPDLAIIALYLAGITWFGARFRHTQKSLKDYYLGGRNAPWWAIALSIVSAETSTLTIIGTPTLAFAGNLAFLQVVFGYLLARVAISALLLPHYFRGEMFTAYELIGRRFGVRLRRLTAGTFLVVRGLAEGIRVFAISIVISVILGTGEMASIVLIVCLTLFYTFEGGMTAVIWTDVVQMVLYVFGAVVSFFVILQHIPGGWGHVVAVAGPAGKFAIFDFRFEPTAQFFSRSYTFWAGLIGGCFLTTASWVVILVQFSLFLGIGVILYVFYQDANLAAPKPADWLYPGFVWRYLPPGLAGLVMAAVLAAAMSNLSAALNSLSSTTILDFYKPLRPHHSEQSYVKLARAATLVWGLALVGVGAVARHWGPVLEAGLTVVSIAYGGLLGVFLLGVLTKRVGENAAMLGMAAGLGMVVYVRLDTDIAWTWYVAIGASVTFLTGWLASFFWKERGNG